MPPRETLRHKEAFEWYYSCGSTRSYKRAAQQFNVSITTIAKWAKRYNWQERLAIRDGEIGKAVERTNIASIVDEKAAMLKILKSQLSQLLVRDPVTGEVELQVRITNQGDLLNTFKTMLLLLGEETGEGGGSKVVFNITSRVPRPPAKNGKKNGNGNGSRKR